MIALRAIDLSWYQNLEYFYNLNFDDLIIISFLSIFISIILHNFFNKTDFKISNENQIEIIEVKKFSFVTKTIAVFFILILYDYRIRYI